jgi:hypothetical protein
MPTTPLLMSELVQNATSNLSELALWPNKINPADRCAPADFFVIQLIKNK